MLKKSFMAVAACTMMLSLSACGDSSRDNELTGQLKKVVNSTPLICPDYTQVDISLGVMRNGVGSMSNQDVWLYVGPNIDRNALKQAVDSGSIVKIKYDQKRLTICTPDHHMTAFEIMKD